MDKGLSIIICTYSPDTNLLKRLLNAVTNLEQGQLPFEVIIIDNNSPSPVAKLPMVAEFISASHDINLIVEKKPGLTNARIAGIKKAKYNWIIFFDDDNEPYKNYLLLAEQLINEYPQVGCWGPGKIDVEFVGKVSSFAYGKKELFQQRNMTETIIDNIRWDQPSYPYGTGMIVKREILIEYMSQVEKGNYTMTDRIGKSLISGGDMQILLTGIKMGYYAGSSPLLHMTHLINSKKTRFKKMLQLIFMLSASAVKTYNQVFPEAPHTVQAVYNKDVIKIAYYQMRRFLFKKPVKYLIYDTTKRMGELKAHVMASSSPTPMLLSLYQKMIQ